MSHYGTYLGGIVRTPGAERQPPPARPEDRPRRDGRVGRAILDALEAPATVGELSQRLGWEHSRVRSMVHALVRRQQVRRVDWSTAPKRSKTARGGQRAGRYQRVTP